jgi:hypothetical protein
MQGIGEAKYLCCAEQSFEQKPAYVDISLSIRVLFQQQLLLTVPQRLFRQVDLLILPGTEP